MNNNTLKRWLIGFGAFAIAGTIPFLSNQDVRAEISEIAETIVEAIQRPEVKLTLVAEKQVTVTDSEGKEVMEWEALDQGGAVAPGSRLRYVVDGSNSGDIEATNLIITQPIPPQMTFVLDSATGTKANTTYSIDDGQTFVETPMVEVTLPDGSVEEQPAPAEAYTHIQWDFADSLEAATAVKVSYEVDVN